VNDRQQRRNATIGWVGAFVFSLLVWVAAFIGAVAFFGGWR
jgi:hypothetical protein